MVNIYEGIIRDAYAEERAMLHNMCIERILVHIGKTVRVHPVVPIFGGQTGVVCYFDDKIVGLTIEGQPKDLAFGRCVIIEV